MSTADPMTTFIYGALDRVWTSSSDVHVAVTEYVGAPSPTTVDFSARHAAYALEPLHGLVDGWRFGQSYDVRTFWIGLGESRREQPEPRCGFAVCALDQDAIEVQLACDSDPSAGDHRLHVWVIDPEVVGPPQRNGAHDSSLPPYGGMGDPIVEFVHREVVVGVLEGTVRDGAAVDLSGGVIRRSYALADACDDCAILAFVGAVIAGDPLGREVIDNTVRAPIGGILHWE